MPERKPVTAPSLSAMKRRGERIVAVTAYDFPSALLADAAGVDVLLVGDSLGMVVLGHANTVPVTVADILHHLRAVVRARPKALVVADLPFMAAEFSEEETLRHAQRLVQEGGAGAVKIEGGRRMAATVRRVTEAGIPVMGHLGLMPQSVLRLGGFRVQGRAAADADAMRSEALLLQDAGAFALVLESVPREVGKGLSEALAIPTIGIGAGPGCDGEVQVWHDLLGLCDGFQPRHAKRYANLGETIRAAISQYADEVRRGEFPGPEHSVSEPTLEDADAWKSSEPSQS